MKRFFLILSLSLCPMILFGQIDVLQAPTELEKNETTRIIREYEKFMRISGDSALSKSQKSAATLKIIKDLYNNDIQVYNDLDSVAKGEDQFLKFFGYAQKFKQVFPQTVNITIDGLTLSKVKYDKLRRYFYIEGVADKKFSWKRVAVRAIKDTVSAKKDSVVYDTISNGFTRKVTFYIRFERTNNISKNFKLLTIARTGGTPKLEPLPTIVTWWLELDPQWKAFFREKLKLEEYPASWEIERITAMPELDISNKPFKTLEPVRKMVFLQKLNCTNTPVENMEPLSGAVSLIELNITKTKVQSLDGIEKLTNLQELNCSGLLLKSVEPLRKLTNLVKLNISENELEDISPVTDLVNLKELDFSSNVKLEDISPIKKLVNLEKLSMRRVKAGSLESARGLVNLIYLDCYNTEVSSLEPIRNHQKIMHLNIDHNPVTTLEPIRNYKFVIFLSLSTSSVLDLSPIKDYINLRELDISNTLITSLGPAIKLEYIRELRCQMSKVPKEEVARFKKNHPGANISYWY